MTRFSSIFSQLLQLFPRLEFEQAVKQHQAERSTKGFSSWGQFVAMLFCQLGRAHSLREICGGLASCEGKLKHWGNANRWWQRQDARRSFGSRTSSSAWIRARSTCACRFSIGQNSGGRKGR